MLGTLGKPQAIRLSTLVYFIPHEIQRRQTASYARRSCVGKQGAVYY